jgi:hypothetical protein
MLVVRNSQNVDYAVLSGGDWEINISYETILFCSRPENK